MAVVLYFIDIGTSCNIRGTVARRAPAFDHPAFAGWSQDEANDQKKPNPAKEQKKQVPHGDW